jgi:hypothetical protein
VALCRVAETYLSITASLQSKFNLSSRIRLIYRTLRGVSFTLAPERRQNYHTESLQLPEISVIGADLKKPVKERYKTLDSIC